MTQFLRAKITGSDTVNGQLRYAWTEQEVDLVTGYHADMLGGRYGTVSKDYALELNNAAVGSGTYVFIRQRGLASGKLIYEFVNPGSGPWKQTVRLKTATVLPSNTYYNGPDDDGGGATLTSVSTAGAALFVDGFEVLLGNRVLVSGEADDTHNGIYVMTRTPGTGIAWQLTRAADADSFLELIGAATIVTEGDDYESTAWKQTETNPQPGYDHIRWGPILVFGTGTDNHVPRWDGTGVQFLQDSAVVVDDSGNLTTPGLITSDVTVGGKHVQTWPGGGSAIVRGGLGSNGLDCRPSATSGSTMMALGMTPSAGFLSFYWSDADNGPFSTDSMGIGFDRASGDVNVLTGTGGELTVNGSPVVSAGATNTFTAANTFAPSSNVVAVTVEGSSGQTADLQQWKNNAGTVLLGITAGGGMYGSFVTGLMARSAAYG